jgi:hypothetical protein
MQFKLQARVTFHTTTGFFVLGELEQVRRQVAGTPAITQRVRWFYSAAIKLGYAYHVIT